VKESSRLGLREKSDERILGSGEFVKQLIQESDKIRKAQFAGQGRKKNVRSYIQKLCEQEKISVAALQSGSRRKKITMVRRQLAQKLVEEWGFSLIETGRHLGVSPSAISKSLFRLNLNKSN